MQNRTRIYLQRYIVYIVIISLIVFALGQFTTLIYKPDKAFNPNLMMLAQLFSYAYLVGNIVMAVVIYGDMKRLKKINWWIIVFTVINKEFGAILCLLFYFINDEPIKEDNAVPESLDSAT